MESKTENYFLFFSQTHTVAKGLLNRLFPYYDELSYVFGKDHLRGARVRHSPMLGPMCRAGTRDCHQKIESIWRSLLCTTRD